MASDPTAFDLEARGGVDGPLTRRITGRTSHGGHRLDTPFISQVADNLWHGGVESGLVLPSFFRHVVSLYPWEQYTLRHEVDSQLVVKMYDSLDQGLDQVDAIAEWVNVCRESGPVLVHCQAGLNRSGLVVARALVLAGDVADGSEAVALMREKRSPAVLCNPVFEDWVVGHGD